MLRLLTFPHLVLAVAPCWSVEIVFIFSAIVLIVIIPL